MRRFKIFAALMPARLVEATATILDAGTGEPDEGSRVDFSRFGYAARWCDGSGMAGFSEDETIETAIKDASEYLESKGWALGDIQYNGKEITQETIDKYTQVINSDSVAAAGYVEYLKLLLECTKQPWYTPARKHFNNTVSLGNIKDLPDKLRSSSDDLISCNDNGEIFVYAGYEIDADGNVTSWRAKPETLPQARELFGLAADAPAIDVVNAAVADILKGYNQYLADQRNSENKAIAVYDKTCGLIGDIIRALCQPATTDVVPMLSTLQVYDCVLDKAIDAFSEKFNVNRRAIPCIIIDYKYLDWSTCTMESIPDEPDITHYKVKLRSDIYKDTKELYIKEMMGIIGDDAEKVLSKYSYATDEWFRQSCEDNWLHIVYGVTSSGKYGIDCRYGSEDLMSYFGSRKHTLKKMLSQMIHKNDSAVTPSDTCDERCDAPTDEPGEE